MTAWFFKKQKHFIEPTELGQENLRNLDRLRETEAGILQALDTLDLDLEKARKLFMNL